jgi:hypothetical protein
VHDARYAKLATDDGNDVVVGPDGKPTPELEVVRLPALVERQGDVPVKEHDGALHRRNLHRKEVPVEHEDGKGKDVGHRSMRNARERFALSRVEVRDRTLDTEDSVHLAGLRGSGWVRRKTTFDEPGLKATLEATP